jgi:hypothetical protein
VIGAVAMAGCNVNKEVRAPSSERLDKIAKEYLHTSYPNWEIDNPPLAGEKWEIVDRGNSWEWRYELPPGMIGGGPVVIIDKRNLKVIELYFTQ